MWFAATARKLVPRRSNDAASPDAPSPDTPGSDVRSAARTVAWAVVIVTGCAFSYSIGWQKGWMEGSGESDAHFNALNQSLISSQVDAVSAEAARPAPGRADGVETAAVADEDTGHL